MTRGNPETLKPYKGQWQHGKTQTIRVPVALADQVLDYARNLDGSTSAPDKVQNHHQRDELTKAIKILETSLEYPGTAGNKIKARVNKALSILKSLDTSEQEQT